MKDPLSALQVEPIGNGWTWLLIALGISWGLFFYELSGEWQINTQYNYGYVVPLLGLVLFWRRWPDRPKTLPPKAVRTLLAAAALLLLLQLPLRLILEANPEWRMMYWVHGAQVLALSFCLLYYAGGWPWVGFFAAPVGFMLIATPWPMNLEQETIQGLMRFVAGLTVSVADWLCPPAVQHGNLIEVAAGVVGIDEACSGVRSLQSALMLSLFLGEMHRLSAFRRVLLLAASLLCVLAANLTRTTFLVWAANTRGLQQMEAWHDVAGNLVMFIVLPSLLALSYLFKPKSAESDLVSHAGPLVLPAMPRWVGIAAIAWMAMTELSTELWFRAHESNLVPNVRWSVNWPVDNPQFKKTPLPERALAVLRCSNSESASWQDTDGNLWSAFVLRWKPGKNSVQLAKGHRPDICFPASGARLVEDFGRTVVQTHGIEFSFQHQSFESGAGLIHAFYYLWSDHIVPGAEPVLEDGSRASRLRAVLAGKRHLGQQVLEVVIRGPESGEEAAALMRARLPELIRPD